MITTYYQRIGAGAPWNLVIQKQVKKVTWKAITNYDGQGAPIAIANPLVEWTIINGSGSVLGSVQLISDDRENETTIHINGFIDGLNTQIQDPSTASYIDCFVTVEYFD